MKSATRRQHRHRSVLIGLGGALLFVAASAALVSLRAAGPSANFEVENGSLSNNTRTITDTQASQGKAVQLGADATIPDPLYGMTVDTVDNVNNIVAAAQAAPRKLTTRIVFDEGTTPADYQTAVNALDPHTFIMGELLDSVGLKKATLQQYHNRTASFLAALGNKVDIWEVGNEVNGNWTGNYSDVSAKITDAYDQVEAAGKRSALTLYYDIDCGNGPTELDPLAFSRTYVPERMKQGLDYVFLSYYEVDCHNIRPSAATWEAYYNQLHGMFPNAKLGFGEVGLADPATSSTLSKAQSTLNYYYSLKINTPGNVGGYFWWYAYQDFLPISANKPLWQAFGQRIQQY